MKQPLCSIVERRNRRLANQYDFQSTIIISGVPRGGTTWLADLLYEIGDTTLLMEPLNLYTLAKITDLPFSWRQYIPEDAEWPEAYRFFYELLTGQIIHPYLFRKWDFPLKLTQFHLIKFCRANKLLPWIVANFPVRPPIFLIRHPCAVVASQLRHGGWENMMPPFHVPSTPYSKEFYKPYIDILASLKTQEEILAAMWCMDNIVPLRHPQNDQKWITVAYESLVKNGSEELKRIFGRLGLQVPPQAIRYLLRPSDSTQIGSPILYGGNQLSAWRKHLTSKQIKMIFDTILIFGMNDIYYEDLEPKYENIYKKYPPH